MRYHMFIQKVVVSSLFWKCSRECIACKLHLETWHWFLFKKTINHCITCQAAQYNPWNTYISTQVDQGSIIKNLILTWKKSFQGKKSFLVSDSFSKQLETILAPCCIITKCIIELQNKSNFVVSFNLLTLGGWEEGWKIFLLLSLRAFQIFVYLLWTFLNIRKGRETRTINPVYEDQSWPFELPIF